MLQERAQTMRAKWVLVGISSLLLMGAALGTGCKMLGLAPRTHADVKAFAKTLQGLNEDMRETLHKIREGQDAEANTELLHDQLHLMRDVLHLVDKAKRESPPFPALHELNHEMRDRWHDVKKGRDRDANLAKLHDHLHQMKQILQGLI